MCYFSYNVSAYLAALGLQEILSSLVRYCLTICKTRRKIMDHEFSVGPLDFYFNFNFCSEGSFDVFFTGPHA